MFQTTNQQFNQDKYEFDEDEWKLQPKEM